MKSIVKLAVAALVLCICAHNTVFAAPPNPAATGTFGDNLTWSFYDNGELYISGNGPIPNRGNTALIGSPTPWRAHENKITKVVIEDGITRIGGTVFQNHKSMTSVIIGRGVSEIGSSAFGNSGLTQVVIPDNVRTLGSGVFEDCTALASVTIGNGITELTNGVFNSSGLTSITIPEGITKITGGFTGCQKLATLYFNAENCESLPDTSLFSATGPFSNCRLLKTIIIGDNVLNAPSLMFSGITSLTTLTIGKKVTRIGLKAFQGCSNLESIVIPDSVQYIGGYAFSGCTSVTSLILGNGLSEVWGEAFAGLRITELTIPEGVSGMRNASFFNLPKLEKVYWNATNCKISFTHRGSPFNTCDSITTMIFGDNVRTIPESVAQQLRNLESITIGSRVNTIGGIAFSGCVALEEIINKSNRPQKIKANENRSLLVAAEGGTFEHVEQKYVTLKVPADAVEDYKQADVWKEFKIEAIK